jgi:hypothetical protein
MDSTKKLSAERIEDPDRSTKKELKILSGDPKAKPSLSDNVVMPSVMIPSYRTMIAIQNGVENNLLFNTWGGLGDQICSEPTLRHALKNFRPKCKMTLATPYQELFKHLYFDDVIDTDKVHPIWDKYFVFSMIYPSDHLSWEFFSHCIVNCVDHPALNALRMQLPVSEREIYLSSNYPAFLAHGNDPHKLCEGNFAFVHPGKHWETKTFPKDWWDKVLLDLRKEGITPVIIGADTLDKRSTVNVETHGCIDLRNKLTRAESVWMLQRCKVLITNDSSPLHMAASTDPKDPNSGHCHIGYIATCKHPDYITHFRKGVWQYRETNLGVGGMWDIVDHCPNAKEEVTVDKIDEKTLRSWLPEPKSVAQWAAGKFNEK